MKNDIQLIFPFVFSFHQKIVFHLIEQICRGNENELHFGVDMRIAKYINKENNNNKKSANRINRIRVTTDFNIHR